MLSVIALLASAALAVASPLVSRASVTVTVPASAPSTAKKITGALVGLSFEQDRFPDWAGTYDEPNSYTMTVLGNVASRAGVAPPIRVGGNTEDKTTYDSSIMYSANTYPAATSTTPYPEASTVLAGVDFWKLATNFPNSTTFIFGLNLKAASTSGADAEAKAIVGAFAGQKLVSLRSLEIGNEPDLYGGSWTPSYYISEWQKLASSAVSTLGGVSSSPPIQLLALANPTSTWSLSALLSDGLLPSSLSPLVKVVSEHHYQGSFCQGFGGAVEELMEKSYVRGNLSLFDAEVKSANAKGWAFELGETNSVSCHGAPGLSNTAGAAVWAVDYIFQAAARGIARVYFHNGIGYKYSFFAPLYGIDDGTPFVGPHVLPIYHALLVAAEATSHPAGVLIAELTTSSSSVAAYGVWVADTGKLLKAVLINSAPYFSSSGASRAGYSVVLSGLGSTGFTLHRLSVPSADAMSGLTYAGQSFETETGKPSGTVSNEQGWATGFSMSATEVVLLSF